MVESNIVWSGNVTANLDGENDIEPPLSIREWKHREPIENIYI